MSLSTRQHEEKRRTLNSPEAEASGYTRTGFTGGVEGAVTRTRDRMVFADAMREPEPLPRTPEQIAARLVADAALAEFNRRAAEDAREREEKIRTGKIKHLN
jgi:hypothetical protein